MNQHALWFFVLLEEAYKLQAQEQEMAADVSLLPHMKDADRKRYLEALRRAKRDIIELRKSNDDYSALEVLKGALNKGV